MLIGGALTRPNLDWYATLAKPSFAPPNSIFPVVWPILYALMAISAWLAWRAPGKEEDRKLAMIWFFIQLAIGVLWSVAFFVMHSPAAGLGVIMAFLVAIAVTIVFFDRLSRLAAVRLDPLRPTRSWAARLRRGDFRASARSSSPVVPRVSGSPRRAR